MRIVKIILLFVLTIVVQTINAQTAKVIVNEVSQGTNTAEYVELLVYGEPVCNEIPTIDIRGWIIDDNDGGTYGTGGVASGCIRLSQDAYWSNIKIGTLIIIYNEADPNTSLPPDDIYDSDNDCVHVVPFGPSTPTNLFEIHASMPTQSDPTYPAVNDPGWGTSYTWNVIGMRQGGDVIQIIDPVALTSVFAVAWGDDNQNSIVYVNDASASGNVYFMDNSIDNDPFNASNWTTIGDVPTDETPGSPNNSANQLWITSMNYGCGSIDTLNIDSIFTDPSCSACDGSVGVNFLGGVSPFSYNWDNGSTASSITNLCNGQFSVTVTDNNGCIDFTTVSVTPPVSFTVTAFTVSNETCDSDNNGIASVTTTGTTGSTSYDWSGGYSGTTITGLPDGVYTVSVTDGSGCIGTSTTTITQGTFLNATIANANGQCFSGNSFTFDGTASESPNSCGAGCPTYTWEFGDGNSTSGNTLADLSPTHSYSNTGNYNVTLTVFDGTCNFSNNISVEVYSEPTVTLTSNDISCNGSNNGSITASASNGTANYTYNWSNSQSGSTISNLSTGNYTVTVSDQHNCTVTDNTSISEPSAISITSNQTNVTCFGGNNGSITITAAGGVSGYQYNWSNSSSGSTINNLSAGTYIVTVTDNNNCNKTTSITITQPDNISIASTNTNTACNGNTGSINLNVSGGLPTYSYLWSNNSTSNNISGLSQGNYSVTVTDQNTCSNTYSTSIIEENFVSISIASTSNVSTPGGNDGSISTTPSGGVLPYSYLWSNGLTTQNLTNITAGNYCVSVYDLNNCSTSICTSITEPANMLLTVTNTNVSCFGGSTGTLSVNVQDGTTPYSYSWYTSPGNVLLSNSNPVNNVSSGVYYVVVTDNSGYSVTSNSITITQPAVISNTMTTTNVKCNGECNGILSASANGGTSPYTYNWDQSSGAYLANLCAGSYTLTITDNNSCVNIFTYNITEPPALSATYSITDTFVCVGTPINLTAIVSGGTTPYPANPDNAITWSGAGTGLSGYGPHTISPTNNSETYSFTVYDKNGCSASKQVTIKTPDPLVIELPANEDLCIGQNTTFCAFGSGGSDSTDYKFMWSNGHIDQGVSQSCQSSVLPGTSTFRVILSDGCSPNDTAYTTISVHEMPAVSYGAANNKGCPPFTTIFSANASQENVTFDWDFDGDGVFDTTGASLKHTYTESGLYNVIFQATSQYGCVIYDTIKSQINVYPSPNIDFIIDPYKASILYPKITADASNSTGVIDSLLFWNFGDGKNGYGPIVKHTYTAEGKYDVVLSTYNEYGCFDIDTQQVIIEPEFTIYIPNAFYPNGFTNNKMFIPKGIGIDPNKFEMFIYDRWGHVIYHTKDLNMPWDGTIKNSGKVGPEGVYIYKILLTDNIIGQDHEYVGHVTIIN